MLGVTITTRWTCSCLCSAAISSGSADSGVYTRPENSGNFSGSPKMWVWQSQACAGTSKLTWVAGCDALARPGRDRTNPAPARTPSRTFLRVNMVVLSLRCTWLGPASRRPRTVSQWLTRASLALPACTRHHAADPERSVADQRVEARLQRERNVVRDCEQCERRRLVRDGSGHGSRGSFGRTRSWARAVRRPHGCVPYT